MWEYKRTNYEFKLFTELEDKLNKEGKEGWEVVYYHEVKPKKFGGEHTAKVLFKRLK